MRLGIPATVVTPLTLGAIKRGHVFQIFQSHNHDSSKTESPGLHFHCGIKSPGSRQNTVETALIPQFQTPLISPFACNIACRVSQIDRSGNPQQSRQQPQQGLLGTANLHLKCAEHFCNRLLFAIDEEHIVQNDCSPFLTWVQNQTARAKEDEFKNVFNFFVNPQVG